MEQDSYLAGGTAGSTRLEYTNILEKQANHKVSALPLHLAASEDRMGNFCYTILQLAYIIFGS